VSNKQKIKQLQQQIRYEEKRMDSCGYGKSDLRYLNALKEELQKTKESMRSE
jgi:hypothetical protein